VQAHGLCTAAATADSDSTDSRAPWMNFAPAQPADPLTTRPVTVAAALTAPGGLVILANIGSAWRRRVLRLAVRGRAGHPGNWRWRAGIRPLGIRLTSSAR